jgi:hypothetical protein
MTHYQPNRVEAVRYDSPVPSPWAGAVPELIIAGVSVVATAAAGYAVAGWMGLAVVAVAAAAFALLVLRFLLPHGTADAAKTAREKRTARPLSGYSHRRFVVQTATSASQGFYDAELRPVLEHLLAARLAERHGVNLYQDPATARKLLCKHRRDAALWRWIDPDPEHRTTQARNGIPRHVLARLIDRLEKL